VKLTLFHAGDTGIVSNFGNERTPESVLKIDFYPDEAYDMYDYIKLLKRLELQC
jgi:hypothetical protein